MENKKAAYQKIGDALHVDPKAQELLKSIIEWGKAAVEAVSGTIAAVGAVISIMEKFGFLQKDKSPTEILFLQLQAEFKAIAAKIDAVSKQVQRMTIAELRATIAAVEEETAKWALYRKDHNADPAAGTVEWAKMLELSDDSAITSNMIEQPEVWFRTFDETDIVNQPWGKAQYAPPKEAGGFVWEYRLLLPLLMRIARSRLAYLLAIEPDFAVKNRAAFTNTVAVFIQVHDRIVSGFVLSPAPGLKGPAGPPQSFAYQDPPPGKYVPLKPQTFAPSQWDQWKTPCGAVDTYGGAGSFETFPMSQPIRHTWFERLDEFLQATNIPESSLPTPQALETPKKDFEAQRTLGRARVKEEEHYAARFYAIFLIRARRAWRDRYQALGLDSLVGAADAHSAAVGILDRPHYARHYAGFHSLAAVMQPSPRTKTELKEPSGSATPKLHRFDTVRAFAALLGPEFAHAVEKKIGPFKTYGNTVSLRRILDGDS